KVADLQKTIDAELAKILTPEQQKRWTELRERGFGGGGFGGPGGLGGKKGPGGFPGKKGPGDGKGPPTRF
ncbi:MAG: hypothetical protein NZO58_06640, partial [Gemmataceae bacterium]|nr:hypothetical protein [Gemmataceae bacterium]